MRKSAFLALLMAVLMLVVSCSSSAGTFAFGNLPHEHSFGFWYDVVPATCCENGEHVRYCKVCRLAETEVTTPPADVAAQNHAKVKETVVPPTEKDWGYTVRVCELCGYTQDRADPVPPRYALLSDDTTDTTPLPGVTAMLFCDTESHEVARLVGRDTPVGAELARRLAVALVFAERIMTNDAYTFSDTYTFHAMLLEGVPPEAPAAHFGSGATVNAGELLAAWLYTGGADAVAGMYDFFHMSEQEFVGLVNARMEKLGVTAHFTSLTAVRDYGTATLYDTAVLTARVLGDDILAETLRAIVPSYFRINGKKPEMYLEDVLDRTVRISAVYVRDVCYFLVLSGKPLSGDLENLVFEGV